MEEEGSGATAAVSGEVRWTEEVEDLLDVGDVDGAVAFLESAVARLECKVASSADQEIRLAAALRDLAGIQDSRGFTLKADELRSRAIALRARQDLPSSPPVLGDACTPVELDMRASEETTSQQEPEDWELVADLLETDPPVFNLKQDAETSPGAPREEGEASLSTPRRRGRGSFLYEKRVLYSDQVDSMNLPDDRNLNSETETILHAPRQDDSMNADYGTRHVLALHDFSPSTRTGDLEKIFEEFKDHGIAIRWVNDTVALAVFRTPSLAQKAITCVPPPYKACFLAENDELLKDISFIDLEPPCPRPKTSARTAHRLITHVMGIKSSPSPESTEFKKQESARKSRITQRQALREDAWGPD